MAVVVTQDCRPYYNYGLHELAKGTVIPAGEFADYLLATGAPVVEQADGPAVDLDGDGVPDGTVAQVLGWVAEDPAKAAQALEAERAGKARATLVDALAKLVGAEGGDGAQNQG
jgi:hypothetical protein